MARLDVLLVRLHPGLSRRKAREVIEKGQVLVDGQVVREAGRAVGDASALRWDPNRPALPRARLSLTALFEDDHVLVVDKPAGLLTVASAPDARDEDTVLARVREYMRHRRPRRPYAHAVHRLDRDTSGALAVALSPDARAGMQNLFRAHRIDRRYLVLVEGRPPADAGTIDRPIADAYEGGRRRLARGDEPAHEALTRWRVRERLAAVTLLEVELGTGRQHQIRVHLAAAGLPVVGDAVYGSKRHGRPARAAPRQMLHAARLAFAHPVTGAAVRVESPLPEDFRRVLARLR